MRLRRVELPRRSAGAGLPAHGIRAQARRQRTALAGACGSRRSIRADADRQRQVILADAYKQAQKTKGEGDAKASAIYADAFGANPEFYEFYRSLEAYGRRSRTRATCWCSIRAASSSSISGSLAAARPSGPRATK